jgi:hypothetical protein
MSRAAQSLCEHHGGAGGQGSWFARFEELVCSTRNIAEKIALPASEAIAIEQSFETLFAARTTVPVYGTGAFGPGSESLNPASSGRESAANLTSSLWLDNAAKDRCNWPLNRKLVSAR